MTDEWPWRYLFTAVQTELGKTEEWFWATEPRIIITMLDEKKKIDAVGFMKLATAVWGGNIYDEDDGEIPGIDKPVEASSVDWLSRRQ